jgi:hypothetical protein
MTPRKPRRRTPARPRSARTAKKTAGSRATKAVSVTSRPASLNAAQLKEYEAWSNAGFAARKRASRPAGLAARPARKQFIVVAEGDSWFDYKPAFVGIGTKDLLGHLQSSGRLNVYRVSKAGDTLENMVYGTDTKGQGPGLEPKLPPQLEQTLAAIRDENADAFFFSGGGNDLAGVELASYINHKDSGMPTLREEALSFIFGSYAETAMAALIAKVRAVKPGIPVFLHGYDYAIPDGRNVNFLGFSFAGPWLKPALTQKRYVSPGEGAAIVRTVVNRFNEALARVATVHPNVHYINLRGTLRSDANYNKDWANELHPTSDGFQLLASVIEAKMLDVLDGN